MWELAIKELKQMAKQYTPKGKLECIVNSVKLVDSTFTLFNHDLKSSQACADDMLNIFPYIVVQANIPRLMAHIM